MLRKFITYSLKIEVGLNPFYLTTLFIIFGSSFFLFFFARKLTKEQGHKLVIILLFSNFILHFFKILIPPYLNDFPQSIKVITPDNICAFSAVFFPFMYLSNNKYLRDYMAYIGIASGIVVYLYPAVYFEANTMNLFSYVEITRFYLSHLLLTLGPIVMLGNKLHTLNHRRILVWPFIFYFVLTYIGLNEIFLKLSKITNASWQDIFSNNYRNGALVFGPMSLTDETFWRHFYWMILPIFKYTYPGTNAIYYVPVLWLVVPSYLLFIIASYLLSLFYTKREAYLDLKKIQQKRKLRLNYKKAIHYEKS